MTDLNLIFQSLPTSVKDWLASDFSQNTINEMGRKYNFNLTQEVVLSQLFLRLVTQDLPPQNFTGALKSELGLKNDEAMEATKIIDEKIIEPISSDLLTTGFDRKLLYYHSPPAGELGQVPPPPAKISEEILADKPFDAAQNKPFILHEEGGARPSESGPSFNFRPPSIAPATPRSQPTKVTIERIVHYSDFYTPLNRAPLKYYQKIKIPKSKWFV